MTLQNRVTPNGTLVAEPWRGMFMGNRGGRIHDPNTRTLMRRRWASKQWITCVTSFKQRHRKVMGPGYTELFFLDEVSALAAGHRPCFECRRSDAIKFAQMWASATGLANRAPDMDRVLHQQRLSKGNLLCKSDIAALPDGAIFKYGDDYLTFRGRECLAWHGDGYRQVDWQGDQAVLITPPVIVEVLKAGYQPVWHERAY